MEADAAFVVTRRRSSSVAVFTLQRSVPHEDSVRASCDRPTASGRKYTPNGSAVEAGPPAGSTPRGAAEEAVDAALGAAATPTSRSAIHPARRMGSTLGERTSLL